MTAPYTPADILRLARAKIAALGLEDEEACAVLASVILDDACWPFISKAVGNIRNPLGSTESALLQIDRAIQLADQGGQGE